MLVVLRDLGRLVGWRVVTGWMWCLSPVVSSVPETCFVDLVEDSHELGDFLEVAALRGRIVSAIADSLVCSTVIEEGV